MTKLVQYIGDADERVITSTEFASQGISSPTMHFSRDQPTDYYRSVSDLVAIYLLAQGDFRTFDGSTLLDIFEHNASPEAAPEVTSVTIGDGDPAVGDIVLPADGSASTPSLRTLGEGAGQAMAGDDPIREQALRTGIFGDTEEERQNQLLGTNVDGVPSVFRLDTGEIPVGSADRRVARDALAQVRGAVSGIRAAGIAAELASARLLLECDGVSLRHDWDESGLAGSVLPPRVETALALVVREAVTNIHRHAHAGSAEVAELPMSGDLDFRMTRRVKDALEALRPDLVSLGAARETDPSRATWQKARSGFRRSPL